MILRYQPGASVPSIYFRIYKDTGKKNTTPLVYNSAGLAATYQRDNGSPVAITLANLTSSTASYSAGGFIYCGNGWYRLDPPAAAFAAGATYVIIAFAEATDINVDDPLIILDESTASRLAPATPGRTLAVDAGGVASANMLQMEGITLHNLVNTGGASLNALIPVNGIADIPTTRAAKIDNLDASVSSRSTFVADATFYNNFQAAIINESDGQQVLAAIVNKINATDVNLAGLSVAAIASAVWTTGVNVKAMGDDYANNNGVAVAKLYDDQEGDLFSFAYVFQNLFTFGNDYANNNGVRVAGIDDPQNGTYTSLAAWFADVKPLVETASFSDDATEEISDRIERDGGPLKTVQAGLGFSGVGADNAKAAIGALASVFAGMTSLAKWLRAMLRSGTADATALAEINTAGGTYNPATMSLQATAAAVDNIDINPVVQVTVSPAVASVVDPRFAVHDLPQMAQGSAPSTSWTIVNESSQPIDLSSKTVRFVAARLAGDCDGWRTLTPLTVGAWQYQSGTDALTVGGTGDNVVTVHHAEADSATPGQFVYYLWNITDKLLLASGRMPIVPALQSAA